MCDINIRQHDLLRDRAKIRVSDSSVVGGWYTFFLVILGVFACYRCRRRRFADNRGERRGGVTVGYDGGATLGIGATLGSVAGSKHFGGGVRIFLGVAGGAGCKG